MSRSAILRSLYTFLGPNWSSSRGISNAWAAGSAIPATKLVIEIGRGGAEGQSKPTNETERHGLNHIASSFHGQFSRRPRKASFQFALAPAAILGGMSGIGEQGGSPSSKSVSVVKEWQERLGSGPILDDVDVSAFKKGTLHSDAGVAAPKIVCFRVSLQPEQF